MLLIVVEMVCLMHACGVHEEALILMLGDGCTGVAFVSYLDVVGVVFIGSIEVVWLINCMLAVKDGLIVLLIVEMGG